MKYWAAAFSICVWMFFTFILVISVIGILFLMIFQDEWSDIGKLLISQFKDE